MSDYRVVHDYPWSPAQLWRALTDPAIIPRSTASGRGGAPVGFEPIVGNRFRYVARPTPGWNGIVECEVIAVEEPTLLRYTWVGDPGGDVTIVENRLSAHGAGTRLSWEHTGFTGVGGFFMAQLLGSVRKKMLRVGLPAVLASLTIVLGILGVTTPARGDEAATLAVHVYALRMDPRPGRLWALFLRAWLPERIAAPQSGRRGARS